MSPDSVKEQIKLATEWLRIYFVLLLADVSGSVALVIRIIREQSTAGEMVIAILGFLIAFGLSLRMIHINRKIGHFINQLNHNN